ncbi:MAG: MFS transporter [Devosia nanyangense]|uniref:MFS transporter n=1 Tax=Devosia nanyangense TaxID=1228055 RepID=A0A933NVT8_9HYPH|nr:MFS transporter [Devosia nanyangense]
MESRYGWVIVAAGAVITCVAMGALFALPVYLQPMADDTGWTRAGISGAMTIGFIVMGIAGFGWGALSDRIGARPVVLMASVLLGAGLILASRATELWVFQFAYGALVGAAGGAFFAPIISATLSWFDKHRSLAVSLVSVGGGIAPMVITPFAAFLIQSYGWRSAMLSIAIGALVIVIPTSLLIRRAPEAAEAAAPAMNAGPVERKPSAAWSVLRTPQFIVLASVGFLCCAAHSGPIFHTVSYAIICGATAMGAAAIYSVEGIAGLFGRLIFGVAADRFGVRRVIVAGLALQAAGIYAYIYLTQINQFYMLASVLGLAYGGVMPLYSVLARDYFSQKVMGTVLGATTMTMSLGMASGPLGGGWLYDTFGTYHWLYIASAAIGLCAAALALAFPPPSKKAESGSGELQPA